MNFTMLGRNSIIINHVALAKLDLVPPFVFCLCSPDHYQSKYFVCVSLITCAALKIDLIL